MIKHKEHRPGVSEVNLVNRHLALLQPVDTAKINAAIEEIDQLYGLNEISFDVQSNKLNFAYDASRMCIECVEEILARHGIQPRQDWWTCFKEEYYRFVDQNIKENAHHEPWSCHSTPRHTRK